MAISLIANTISGTNSGGTTSSAIDTSGASLLVVCVGTYQLVSEPDPISDSKSNTWTKLTAVTDLVNRIRIWYSVNPTVGSGHTFTSSGTNSYSVLAVFAFSGANTTSPFDQESGAGASQPGSITPSENNCVLTTFRMDKAAGNPNGTESIDSGFTKVDTIPNSNGNYFGMASAYLVQTTATAKNPDWGSTGWSSSSEPSVMAVFKAAAAAAGHPAMRRLGMPIYGAESMVVY